MAYVGSPIRFAPLLLAGCSLLYNPNNIPQGGNGDAKLPDTPERRDGPPDAEIIADANPNLLALMTLEPGFIVEGTGDGSSRPEVLVIHGKQMVQGATVSITAAGGGSGGSGGSATSVEVVGDGSATVSNDGETLAVEVVAHVDQTIDAGSSVALTVTVTQPTGSGSDVATASLTWNEDGLAELIAGSGSAIVLSGTNQYSEVAVTGGTVTASGTAPVIVRSTSSITMTPAIDISASGATPGVGGGAGGGAGGMGTGPGGGHAPAATAPGGGGGGFATTGAPGGASNGAGGSGGGIAGDPLVTSYATNQSSGGGGADVAGGGGGGTIELTAGGTLTVVGAITSSGATGGTGGGGLSPTGGGGGGTGGVIVLRGGATAAFGALTVGGGGGGAGGGLGTGGAGGSGGAGRIRIDEPTVAGSVPANAHQGLSFDAAVPSVFDSSNPSITIDGTAGDSFVLYVLNSLGQSVGSGDDVFTETIGTFGQGAASPIFPIAAAYKLCLTPVGGNPGADPESTNCVDVAYIPPVQ